jgi:hypothetical protein
MSTVSLWPERGLAGVVSRHPVDISRFSRRLGQDTCHRSRPGASHSTFRHSRVRRSTYCCSRFRLGCSTSRRKLFDRLRTAQDPRKWPLSPRQPIPRHQWLGRPASAPFGVRLDWQQFATPHQKASSSHTSSVSTPRRARASTASFPIATSSAIRPFSLMRKATGVAKTPYCFESFHFS